MKKRLSFMIAAGLMISMLGGCGNTNTTTKESSESSKSSETKTSVESSEVKEESIYPDYLNLESARPIVKEGEEITLKVAVKRRASAETPVEDTWFFKFVEEKLNINLEVEWVTADERKALMLNSDDLPDIMVDLGMTSQDVVKYGVENGQFLPLNEWMSEELTPNMMESMEAYADKWVWYEESDGNIYSLPRVSSSRWGAGDSMPYYRMFISNDYLDAAGITELPATLDEYVDMLRTFKAMDAKDMGVDEIYPMISLWGYEKSFFANALGWALSSPTDLTEPAWDMTMGEMVIPCLEDKFVDYITLYNTLYTEGLLHPDYFTLDKVTVRALEGEGAVAVCCDAAPYNFDPEGYEDYVAQAPITSEYTDEAFAVATNIVTAPGAVLVSASTEYPELCMRFLDYMCSAEGQIYMNHGAPKGSEDTMGMYEGWTYEDGSFFYEEVTSGKYESSIKFIDNVISMATAGIVQFGDYELLAQAYVGVQNPEFTKPNINTGDGNYRYLVREAVNGLLVEAIKPVKIESAKFEDYSDLKLLLQNEVDTEFAKFVTGQRDLAELPEFIKDLKEMGGDEYAEIVLESYEGYTGPTKNGY